MKGGASPNDARSARCMSSCRSVPYSSPGIRPTIVRSSADEYPIVSYGTWIPWSSSAMCSTSAGCGTHYRQEIWRIRKIESSHVEAENLLKTTADPLQSVGAVTARADEKEVFRVRDPRVWKAARGRFHWSSNDRRRQAFRCDATQKHNLHRA
jgi:hypothetical protein